MSWPLNYDPASQSMSFEGRDKDLYPNSLASFEQAVLAAGDICFTYCDRGSNRRPSPENVIFEVGYKKVENKEAEGTGSGEDRCAFDTSLHDNSYEAHKSPNSFFINDRASTHPNDPTNPPYFYLSVGGCSALSDQALRDLSLKDRTSEGDKWSSVSLPVSPAAIITTTEKDLVIVNIDHGTSEAKSSTPTERPCSPQSSVEEKPAPIRAYPCPRQAQIAFKFPNKEVSSFLRRLLHPKENIIKQALQIATEVFCLKHKKIEQSEKQPSDVDIEKKVLSKRDVKEWKAMRGYKSLFSRKWVQSVAKAIGKGREEEKDRNAVAL